MNKLIYENKYEVINDGDIYLKKDKDVIIKNDSPIFKKRNKVEIQKTYNEQQFILIQYFMTNIDASKKIINDCKIKLKMIIKNETKNECKNETQKGM